MNRVTAAFILAAIIITSNLPNMVSGRTTYAPEIASNGIIIHENPGTDLKIERMIFDDTQHFSILDVADQANIYMSHFELAYRVPQVHARNPNVICLLYRNIRAVYTRTPDEYDLFFENGWILRDEAGTPIKSTVFGYTIVDIGNPNYQTWVANWIKSYMDDYGYNGVFLDNCLPSTEILWSTSPSPAINPRTGEPYTSAEFKEDVISLVNRIKSIIGDGEIIGNGILNGERFFNNNYHQRYVDMLTQSALDGIESECWLMTLDDPNWYSESKWKDSVDFAVWLQENFLGNDNMFLPVCYNAGPYDQEEPELPPQCTKEQYALYGFGTLLLAADTNGHNYMNFAYYDSAFVHSLFDIELGTPTGNYYMTTGTHVYTRDYTKTKILVNPTSTTYTVNLDQTYRTFDGQLVGASINLQPHTAQILLKT